MRDRHILASLALLAALALPRSAAAQLGLFSPGQRRALTAAWTGPRFSDGRPRVPDALLARLKTATAEQAWDTLQDAGYHHQFAGGWQIINPGARLVGRVVTAVFMPSRPDVGQVIRAAGQREGRIGDENSWIIDVLQPGDVLVVDLFGKLRDGTIIGDNLGTAIYAKSHNGLIVDGAIRDTVGLRAIPGFTIYTRGADPSALSGVMLMGINVPIRIGEATVMPGDVALGGPEGVTFIPPQLAERVAETAEDDEARDAWGHEMLREGRYTPGQIDGRWTPEMRREFTAWRRRHPSH